MKVAYLIVLAAVAFEAGLSVWPESFAAAAATGETVLVKPASKGKNRKIKRTIRVRESAPPPSQSPAAAPAQPVASNPLQPAVGPISNEVHVKPDISVQMSPQQQQQHPQQAAPMPMHMPTSPQPQHHQQQPAVVHVHSPAQASPPPRVAQKLPQQQPIVELPDDDDDDDQDGHGHEEDADDDDDDKGHEVRTENLQIVPYQEHSIVAAPQHEQQQPPQPKLQIVPRNPVSQLIEVGKDQVPKLLAKPAGDLLEQPVVVVDHDDEDHDHNGSQPIGNEILPIDGAPLTGPKLPNANVINRRYNPLGWPLSFHSSANAVAVPGYGQPYTAGQVPVIQVNIDEQARQPWLAATAPAYATVAPAMLPAAAAPIWQQPQPALSTAFFSAPTVGAVVPAAAGLYQPAAYPIAASPLVESPRYYGGAIAAGLNQPSLMMQAAPPMMMAAGTTAVLQQQPIMVQPVMVQPADFKIKAKKRKHPKKQQQVVVEVEEPAVETQTTWVKKEPQFNQYVEERPAASAATKVVEVVKPKEEIEWETVRIPKIKNNAAAGQH